MWEKHTFERDNMFCVTLKLIILVLNTGNANFEEEENPRIHVKHLSLANCLACPISTLYKKVFCIVWNSFLYLLVQICVELPQRLLQQNALTDISKRYHDRRIWYSAHFPISVSVADEFIKVQYKCDTKC